jgi:hypothetical protein
MGERLLAFALRRYAFAMWSVLAISVAFLTFMPIFYDVMAGLAWADFTALNGRSPHNPYDIWLSRGIGYKLYLYASADFSRSIFPDTPRLRVYAFNVIFILFGSLLIHAAIQAFLLKNTSISANRSRQDRLETWAFGMLLFLPATLWSWAQDTHVAVLLCVLGIALALSPSKRAQWSSGVVLVLLFLVKGVTACDFLFVVGAAAATGRRRLYRVLGSALAASAAIGVAYLTVMRPELDQLLQASRFQLDPSWRKGVSLFLSEGVVFAFHDPAPLLAAVALAITLYRQRGKIKRPSAIYFAAAAWLFALPALLIQHEFFGYHYQELTLSAWLCLAAVLVAQGQSLEDFFRLSSSGRSTRLTVLAVCCVDLLLIAAAFQTNTLRWFDSTNYDWRTVETRLDCSIQAARAIRSTILDENTNAVARAEILDLSWPVNYGLNLPVATHFFFPLPLHHLGRLRTPMERAYLDAIQNYRGEFVIAERHVLDSAPALAQFQTRLDAEYRLKNLVGDRGCPKIELWRRVDGAQQQPAPLKTAAAATIRSRPSPRR